MSEVEWGSEGKELPKPKKRVPTWLWFCGGGCMLAVILGVVVVAIVVKMVGETVDQPKQWEELRRELPFDAQPEGWKCIGTGVFAGLAPGIDDMWQIQAPGEMWQAQISRYSGDMATELREQIAAGELGDDTRKQLGPFGLFEDESGTFDVQGRELHWLRFQTFEKSAASESADEQGELKPGDDPSVREAIAMAFKQRIMLVDLTAEGDPGALVLQYTRIGTGSPATPEQVQKFLAPFHVGPNR